VTNFPAEVVTFQAKTTATFLNIFFKKDLFQRTFEKNIEQSLIFIYNQILVSPNFFTCIFFKEIAAKIF